MDKERGYNKKMQKMKKLIKECETTRHYEKLNKQKRSEAKKFMEDAEKQRKLILKGDLTKMHQER